MGRQKKQQPRIEQPIRLSPDVTVLISAPADKWPVIEWNGPVVTVALAGATVKPRAAKHQAIEEPEADTPEEAEARAILEQRFPPKKQPLTSEQAAIERGMDPNLVNFDFVSQIANR